MEAIDKGLILPAIFVFVNGGPVSHHDYPVSSRISKLAPAKGNTAFVKELIPHIDKTYRTIAERKGRVLEGYSQGGRGPFGGLSKSRVIHCSSSWFRRVATSFD